MPYSDGLMGEKLMGENELRATLERYNFYHIIQLTEHISTPGNPKHVPTQRLVLDALSRMDLEGKRVLDIGCRDGLFSFEAEKRGSTKVIGIDNDLSRPAIEFLIPYFDSAVEMYEMNLFDLEPTTFGLFDVVILAGVLYHLRYPFWALKLVRDVLKDGGRLILETAIWCGARSHAMLYCPIGKESPYEPTSCTFFNEKGLVDALGSLGIQVETIEYLLRKPSPGTIARKSKRTADALVKHMRGLHTRSNIDRAVFSCTVMRQSRDPLVAEYWDGIHDIHTRLGG